MDDPRHTSKPYPEEGVNFRKASHVAGFLTVILVDLRPDRIVGRSLAFLTCPNGLFTWGGRVEIAMINGLNHQLSGFCISG